MWAAYHLLPGAGPPAALARAELEAALRGPGLLWVDLADPTPEEAALLADPFRFHPLAIEDAVSSNLAAPKVEDFDSYLFVIVHGVDPRSAAERPEIVEADLFIGPSYLVTVHRGSLPAVEATRARWLEGLWRTADRADTLAHLIVDHAVDDFFPVVEALEDRVEALEEEVLRLSPEEISRRVPALRRALARLERAVEPQRELVYRLGRREWPLIREESLIYFRDVYDHLLHAETTLEALRQRTDVVLQVHLGAMANRTNEVLKVLSLIGTVFLPLTFLVGVYGMNFRSMPELEWRYGYFAVWGVVAAIIVGMLAYFRWRRWL